MSSYYVHTSDSTKDGVYNVKTFSATYEPHKHSGTYAIRSNVSAVYGSVGTNIVVNSNSHGFVAGDNVYLQFSNVTANIVNGLYTVTTSNANYFTVGSKNGNTTFVVLPTNTSNLTASSGIGNTNNYVTLSSWVANSNVKINVGDSVNIGGNLVSVVFTNLTSGTIIVSPALPGNIVANTVFVDTRPFNAFGNVIFFDSTITLFVNASSFVSGDNLYINFETSDTSLSNDRYTLLKANSRILKVNHRDITNAASFTGNVNVHSLTSIVTSNFHGLSNGENVFVSFISCDTGNATNGIYRVSGAAQNTFNITTSNSVVVGGSSTLKTSNLIMNVASHGFSSNDSVYIWFRTGDTANLDNGYHTVTVLNDNEFSVQHDTIPSSNGNLTVYRNYMNVTINRAGHGFSVGNDVYVMFETGNLANVANGIYRVNGVANTNTYNILHDSITITGNLNNLLTNVTGSVYVSGT